MYAVLIPLPDLYYAAKNSKGKIELILNKHLFTPLLVDWLARTPLDLFVLIDKPEGADAPLMLLAPDKMVVSYDWATLYQYLTDDFEEVLPDEAEIIPSQDLVPISLMFKPQAKRWTDAKYTQRILITHITPSPDVALLTEHGIKPLRMQNSYISPGCRHRVTALLEGLKENLRGRKALIILDNDDTLLNNRLSRLWYRTILNESVLEFAKETRELLLDFGVEVTCLSMSAREKQAELNPLRGGHPMSMDCIAETVTKMWFPINYDRQLSFSYPQHTHLVKQTKAAHVLRLLSAGQLALSGGVIVLVDDCEIELDPVHIAEIQCQLRNQFQVELVVVSVRRHGLTPAETVNALLSSSPPLAPQTPSSMGLFSQPTQGSGAQAEEPSSDLAEAFDTIRL